jgi:hypothetical protein
MNRDRFRINISVKCREILDEYCLKEKRTRSNMIEIIILKYDEYHKDKEY